MEALCPCGTGKDFKDCCEPLLNGSKKAPTAESLMRSRYTAFVVGNIQYIQDTQHPSTREEVDVASIEAWSSQSQWMGLRMVRTEKGLDKDEAGIVEFVASYVALGKEYHHHEEAEFKKDKGVWYFVDGKVMSAQPISRAGPKIGRNDPCHCGSGKKYKKCHGA
jgi:SEC-C motif-containing protein